MAKPYWTGSLASEDESKQKWTQKVDLEAKTLFKTLSEAEIRRRQTICGLELAKMTPKTPESVALDVQRKENALMREMLTRC